MSKHQFFQGHFDVPPEMLLDLVQQAMAGLPTVSSHRLVDGDRIEFRTTFTLTSWGEDMVAEAAAEDGGSVLRVTGKPRMGILSTPWGEEIHAATIESQLLGAVATLVTGARANPFVMLQADHRRVEALFARIRLSSAEDRVPLVDELVQALQVHMALEEEYVYPLLSEHVDDRSATTAEVEHELARDGVAQLESLSPDEPGFDGALAMVVAGIEHHVIEEEAAAFPALTARLGPEALAELAETLTEARAELLQARTTGSNGRSSRRARPKRDGARGRSQKRGRGQAAVDPDDASKAELVERAKKAGVSGYSHMTKAELADALS